MSTTTGATSLVKTFGTTKPANPGSQTLADINIPEMKINGADFDIIRGLLESDQSVTSEVKNVIAVLMLEAAKGLNVDITEIIELSNITPGKISIPEIGLDMINKLRPITSQIGIKTVNASASDVTHINRNIIS